MSAKKIITPDDPNLLFFFTDTLNRRIEVIPVCYDFSNVFIIVKDRNIQDKLYVIDKNRLEYEELL